MKLSIKRGRVLPSHHIKLGHVANSFRVMHHNLEKCLLYSCGGDLGLRFRYLIKQNIYSFMAYKAFMISPSFISFNFNGTFSKCASIKCELLTLGIGASNIFKGIKVRIV
jgi:hypothetical protein